jgi:hypothetical protein
MDGNIDVSGVIYAYLKNKKGLIFQSFNFFYEFANPSIRQSVNSPIS